MFVMPSHQLRMPRVYRSTAIMAIWSEKCGSVKAASAHKPGVTVVAHRGIGGTRARHPRLRRRPRNRRLHEALFWMRARIRRKLGGRNIGRRRAATLAQSVRPRRRKLGHPTAVEIGPREGPV